MHRIVEGDQNRSPGRAGWASRRADTSGAGLLERDSAAFYHQVLSTPCLAEVRGAEGPWIELADGQRVLDFHGNSVHQIGHAHPAVLEAIGRGAQDLAFSPRRFANQKATELAERLIGLAPGTMRGDARVLMVPSGSLAVGVALKIARAWTGRHRVISFADSFHGASLCAASAGGQDLFRRGMGPMMPGTVSVPAPGESGGDSSAGAIERELEAGGVAAVLAEPVRATTVQTPPPGYWQRVREACDAAGALLIFDEIPTGLGRSGRLWVSEWVGVTPDILVTGKGLGGGVFPQAAVVGRAALNEGGVTPIGELAIGHYTHEKSPLGAAAALATLGVIESEGLVARAEAEGARWERELGSALEGLPVRAVRRVGLMLAVELEGGDAEAIADRAMYAALARGLSFKVGGGRSLVLGPPLNTESGLLDRATGIVAGSLREACG